MLQCNMWMFDVFKIRAWSWANLVWSLSFVFSKCCYKLVYVIKDLIMKRLRFLILMRTVWCLLILEFFL